MVKSTHCSCRRPEFSFGYLPITAAPGHLKVHTGAGGLATDGFMDLGWMCGVRANKGL